MSPPHKAAKKPPQTTAVPKMPSGKIARRIVAMLRGEPGRVFTAHEITVKVGHSSGAVRKEMTRLTACRDERPAPLVRVERGLYRAWLSPAALQALEEAPPRVHGLQLAFRVPQTGGEAPPRAYTHAREGWLEITSSKSIQRRLQVMERWATVQVFRTGTVLLSLDSSKNPLDARELANMTPFLMGAFTVMGLPWVQPKVASMEVNRDFKVVRLRGRELLQFRMRGGIQTGGDKELTLQELQSAIIRIYNKEELGVMRMEARLEPIGLTLTEASAMITNMVYGPLQVPEGQVVPDDHAGGYS